MNYVDLPQYIQRLRIYPITYHQDLCMKFEVFGYTLWSTIDTKRQFWVTHSSTQSYIQENKPYLTNEYRYSAHSFVFLGPVSESNDTKTKTLNGLTFYGYTSKKYDGTSIFFYILHARLRLFESF